MKQIVCPQLHFLTNVLEKKKKEKSCFIIVITEDLQYIFHHQHN